MSNVLLKMNTSNEFFYISHRKELMQLTLWLFNRKTDVNDDNDKNSNFNIELEIVVKKQKIKKSKNQKI